MGDVLSGTGTVRAATCKVNDGVDVYVAVERVKVRVKVKVKVKVRVKVKVKVFDHVTPTTSTRPRPARNQCGDPLVDRVEAVAFGRAVAGHLE